MAGILNFTACKPIYYIPNTHNVPLLKNKGNTNISLAVSDYTLEMQVSHAITDNIGLIGNVSYFENNSSTQGSTQGKGTGFLGEFGAGWFRTVGRYFIFETYGIFGRGGVMENVFTSSGNSTHGYINADIKKYTL